MMCYNLFFTAFFIPFIAVTNFDLNRKATYYDSSYLIDSYMYYQGQKNLLFNRRKFIMWFMVAILESIFIFFFFKITLSRFFYFQYASDFNIFSFTLFFTVVIGHNFKLFHIVFEYRVISMLGLALNIISFLVFVVITNNSPILGYFKNINKTLFDLSFWILQLFLLGSLIIISLVTYTVKRHILPTFKDKIRGEDYIPKSKEFIKFLEKSRQEEEQSNARSIFK